ncbi:Bifunctional ligase/repressor BirA [Aquisphaera giovannonii]|uniref:Bifunctional ligase/repressor BirA n=1 Tax=Aquisphaera giovannonii TaxID=406548 RepID=A0A5B9W622_9BACT|nr:biotin--[acetyl-CoA-carboxylase] ligase [Aquisphaera giovannonii]QEH36102.1 Bifunctional ligase/repressor BirA [Aquisphaera giovannonii]
MATSPPPGRPALNVPLLRRLRAAAGGHVPLAELGRDRARVAEDLEALGRFGFQIEDHPYLGVAYRGPSPRLCPDQIEHELPARRIGRRIAVWNRVTSTNDVAARAADSPANDGLVVLAEEQTAGRGQRGRSWTAPAGSSILMSALLFPPPRLTSGPDGSGGPAGNAWLTALAAVATAELVAACTGRPARIKWPNDVRVDGRKVAGILVERALPPAGPGGGPSPARPGGVVIGVGLNVSLPAGALPEELRPRVASLDELGAGPDPDRSELARELILGLDRWYDAVSSAGPAGLAAAWSALSEHLGRAVRVSTPDGDVAGRLLGLSLERGLLLEHAGPAGESAVRPVPLACVLGLSDPA